MSRNPTPASSSEDAPFLSYQGTESSSSVPKPSILVNGRSSSTKSGFFVERMLRWLSNPFGSGYEKPNDHHHHHHHDQQQQQEQGQEDVKHLITRRWRNSIIVVITLVALLGLGSSIAQRRRRRRRQQQHPNTGSSWLREVEFPNCSLTNYNTVDPIARLEKTFTLHGLRAAVAADHEVCSKVGIQTLQKGGHAVDAAVSVGLCLGVANPESSGLGGGGFILTYADEMDPTKKDDLPDFIDARKDDQQRYKFTTGKVCEVIDSREIAPGAAGRDMYDGLPIWASAFGGLAIPVPGEIKGWELAHARHGRLPWSELVDPSIELAQNGVVVTPYLASVIKIMSNFYQNKVILPFNELNVPFNELNVDHYLREMLTKDGNWSNPLMAGDMMRNPRLAETLTAIRDHGSKVLYEGPLAEKLVTDVQKIGGLLTTDDLANYRATLRSPVVGRGIMGTTIVGVGPPSSGGATVIGATRFLAGFSSPLAMDADTLSVHRLVEALKHAFAIRMSLSDPNYNTRVVEDAVFDLVVSNYMDQLRRQRYRDNTTLPMSQYGGIKWAQLHDTDGAKQTNDAHEGDRRRKTRRLNGRRFGYLDDHGTSHFSIVDTEGNAVAVTSSVNLYFGSGFVSPSTGIVTSSTMDDFGNPGRPNLFGLKPSEANFVAPGKKPLSSMSPTMVFRELEDSNEKIGGLMLVTGASGGPKIISAVTNVIMNHLWLGMPLFDSVLKSRVHNQLLYHESSTTTLEKGSFLDGAVTIDVSNRTRTALVKRGHRILDVDFGGTVQAISIDHETNELTAVSDVRKGGIPAGY